MVDEDPEYVRNVALLALARNAKVAPRISWFVMGDERDGRCAVEIGPEVLEATGIRSLGGRVLVEGQRIRVRYEPPVSLPFTDPDKGAVIYNHIVEVTGVIGLAPRPFIQLNEARITCSNE